MADTRPSGWWYAAAATVAGATVVVTGVLGIVRATRLMDEVDAFQHFSGSGTSEVYVDEPGRYAIYHEWVERSGAGPNGSGTPVAEPEIQVTGPDGRAVAVEPSGVTYGWGKEQAEAIGSFRAPENGRYRIRASGTEGRLAFGKLIPSGPLYGFGPALVGAAAILVACAVGSLIVGQQRRGPDPGHRRTWTLVAGGATVVAAIGALVAAIPQGANAGETVRMEGSGTADEPAPECRSEADFETGLCGPTFEELREMNLAYADRVDFAGDPDAAAVVADQAAAALQHLAATTPDPSPDQVREALLPVSTAVTVSAKAVRTAGAAFAIEVDGGCVFGSVYQGSVEAEVGGYVNDGGCLAEYGH